MKDKGLNIGLIQEFETKSPRATTFLGFRSMFFDNLRAMNVPFYEPCCPEKNDGKLPVSYNTEDETLSYYDPETDDQVEIPTSNGIESFTTIQRDALTPTFGTIVYDSDLDAWFGYKANGTWLEL